MSIPTILFSTIIVIAITALTFYYLPVLRRPKTKNPSWDPATTRVISSPLSQDFETTPPDAVTPKATATHKTVSRPYAVSGEFGRMPDADAFHISNRINSRRWQDLEYALDDLAQLTTHSRGMLNAVRDPANSTLELARLCSVGNTFNNRMVKLVNTQFLSPHRHIDDIKDAVNYLNTEEFRQLIHIAEVFTKGSKLPGPLDIEELWNHSLATARITSWLSRNIDVEIDPALASTGALIHDIGKIVLQRWRPETFRLAIQRSIDDQCSLTRAVTRGLGIGHDLAGILLLEKLEFPECLVSLVKSVNLQSHDEGQPESAVVHLAGEVTRYLGTGDDGERCVEEIPVEIREITGIEHSTITDFMSDSFRKYIRSALADISLNIRETHTGNVAFNRI